MFVRELFIIHKHPFFCGYFSVKNGVEHLLNKYLALLAEMQFIAHCLQFIVANTIDYQTKRNYDP
jgi:hypothetical protein